MPDRPVITNNTPLVALWTLDRLDIFQALFNEVLIPKAVFDEFLAAHRVIRQASLEKAPWIRPVPLQNPQRAFAFSGLDRGEAEVLALAEEYNARLVILDERKARQYAQRLKLPLTGTIGVFLLAKEKGLVGAVAPLLEQLQREGLFLHPALVEKALELAGEVAKLE